MNQKNLIIILVIIIMVLTGALGYFMVNKNVVPQSQNKDVFQNNQNQQPQTNKSITPPSKLTKLDELGIEVEFSEGYDITKSEGEKGEMVILFGPKLSEEMGRIYELYKTPKQSSDEVIAEIKKNNPGEATIIVKPEVENINNTTVVKWAEGGSCEVRIMEMVGPKNNYRFFSNGCGTEQKVDFDYFEKTIKTIKFL